MRVGLFASMAGHSAIIVWGLLALPDAGSFPTPSVETLPVELVSVSEFTQLQLGERDADQVRDVSALAPTETPAEEVPAPVERPAEPRQVQPTPPAPTPPAPTPPEPTPPAPTLETEPEPVPDAAAEAGPAPEAAPVSEPVPAADPAPQPIVTTARPRTKPAPPRPTRQEQDFNSNQIAALLNKVEPSGGTTSNTDQPASLGTRSGRENIRMTQSELDALRSQVSACWNPPVGAAGAEDLSVRVRFNLSQSGEVSGGPEVLNSSTNPAFQAAASSAVRAVMRCAPYSLPIAKYDDWQEVILNFDPRELLGG
ncbi:hypothetical protein GCM10011316_01190 [Roseibium aquae]|uniref:Cell division and transport-associated protein TolA n=1 Tax=Roseibium aquae TaxID=1323746 RepID=A0A916T5M5_9HYPH|nr:TonB C-terminal domain-containing protein [Roseibium aquae]GGB32863.1 hypothetical protein GCM10011316_01190 [Roseibium aquae]